MSETDSGFQVPAEQPFDTEAFQGSMQQVLQDNIGTYVSVDFLIGTQSIVTKQGILYAVGAQFIVLYDDVNQQYTVCDIFAVKFITFYLPGHRPGQVSNGTTTETSAQPRFTGAATAVSAQAQEAVMTPAQAAYSHVVRGGNPRR